MGQRDLDGRYTSQLARLSVEDRRRKVALIIASCNGNLRRAAHYLGVHRSHLYRLINTHGLYPVVNAARKAAAVDGAHKRRLKKHGISCN